MTKRVWTSSIAGMPAIGASMLPKVVCPVCSPGYAALLTSLGVGFLASARYLLPFTAVMLTVTVASLFVDARKRRSFGPLTIGITAAALILVGKFVVDSALMMYPGVGLLVLASAWNAVARRATTDFCAGCLPAEVPTNVKADEDKRTWHVRLKYSARAARPATRRSRS